MTDEAVNADKQEWDPEANSYAANISHFTSLHAFDLITAIKPHLLAPGTRTVLDLGCGTAAFATAYLRHFPHGIPGQTVLCTDVSPAMVEVARSTVTDLLPASGCQTVFDFRVEDATLLENVADSSVQAVVSVFCVLHTAGFQDSAAFWDSMTTSSPMVDISGRSPAEVDKLRMVFMTKMGFSDDGGAIAMITASNVIVGELSGEE